MANLSANVGYLGGKSYRNRSGSGKWIASMLPVIGGYCEPFSGMAGTLLQRPLVKREILNDADGLIVNWWRCVRDIPDAFNEKLELIPLSEREFENAVFYLDFCDTDDVCKLADEGPDLRLGVATHIVLSQSLKATTSQREWRFRHSTAASTSLKLPEVHRLARRIRKVQLLCRDGVEVIKDVGRNPDVVIYADPPYPTSVQRYSKTVDMVALGKALQDVQGPCAISGNEDEWDGLGWMRHEHKGTASPMVSPRKKERIEVLWTNFDPADSKKNRLF